MAEGDDAGRAGRGFSNGFRVYRKKTIVIVFFICYKSLR